MVRPSNRLSPKGFHTHGMACLMLTALSAVGVCSCSSRPDVVLSDQDAASLLADLQIADSYASIELNTDPTLSSEGTDSMRRVLRQSILKRHGVTEATLDTTLGWYGHNLDKYERMYEMVIENINQRKGDLAAKTLASTSSQPSLWPYPSQMRLQGEQVLPFQIENTPIDKGARILLEAKTINSRQGAEMLLCVQYADGSMGYIQRTVAGNGRQSVSLQTDSTKTVSRAWGYMHTRQKSPLLLDSVSLYLAPLNKASYYEVHSVRTWSPK